MSNETSAKVHVTKSFTAGKDELYKAWTEPEKLKQWWKPMNKQLQDVENDIRQGGKVVYRFEGNLTIKGEYKEAAPAEKLVYSWNWELPEEAAHKGEYLLTIQFKESGNGSTLDVTQENFKDEHAIKPHQEGWEEALNDLKDYLETSTVAQEG